MYLNSNLKYINILYIFTVYLHVWSCFVFGKSVFRVFRYAGITWALKQIKIKLQEADYNVKAHME